MQISWSWGVRIKPLVLFIILNCLSNQQDSSWEVKSLNYLKFSHQSVSLFISCSGGKWSCSHIDDPRSPAVKLPSLSKCMQLSPSQIVSKLIYSLRVCHIISTCMDYIMEQWFRGLGHLIIFCWDYHMVGLTQAGTSLSCGRLTICMWIKNILTCFSLVFHMGHIESW